MHTTNIYKKTKTNELSTQLKILVTEQQEKKKTKESKRQKNNKATIKNKKLVNQKAQWEN